MPWGGDMGTLCMELLLEYMPAAAPGARVPEPYVRCVYMARGGIG
jgi:hypothetical protein